MSLPTHQPEESVLEYCIRTGDYSFSYKPWRRPRPSRANQPTTRRLWHRAVRRQQLRRLRRELDVHGFDADPELRVGYCGVA